VRPTARPLTLLEELAARTPPVPVLVLTEADGLADRVQIARMGARGFLHKPLAPAQAAEAVVLLLERIAPAESRVLAVDDDPAVLETLCGRCSSPASFASPLSGTAAVLGDLDGRGPRPRRPRRRHARAHRDRALPSAARRSPLGRDGPVVFLTARLDAETIRRVFRSRRDDFVNKPIVGPELVARIANRLERTRLQATLAEIDPLTGVANRRHSTQALERLIRLAERFRQPMSVAVIDLGGLKGVNDRDGYAAGDRVLRRLGGRLLRAFGGDDAVGRWGGGTFVVGIHGLGRAEGVQRWARCWRASGRSRCPAVDGRPFTLTLSAGVAEYPADGTDLQRLYLAADGALTRARGIGSGSVIPVGWAPDRSAGQFRDGRRRRGGRTNDSLGGLLVHALTTPRSQHPLDRRWPRSRRGARGGGTPGAGAAFVLLDWDLPGVDGLAVLSRHGGGGGPATDARGDADGPRHGGGGAQRRSSSERSTTSRSRSA